MKTRESKAGGKGKQLPPRKLVTEAEFGERSVGELLLDAKNPRLPEGLTTSKATPEEVQGEILEYFRTQGNLDELAQSYADNGFFKTEPLIVTREGAPGEKFIVLEGNRRLATLQLLLDSNRGNAEQLGVAIDEPLRARLKKVPVLSVKHRADADPMIGFRHIGGLKFWDSEAKARWIAHHVEASKATDDPFGHVARMVGMPRAQIRYYYLAGQLVAVAREELKYDARKLTHHDRFGVFLRAVENPKIREFIGLDEVTSYKQAKKALADARSDAKPLVRVLQDLADPDPNGKFLIGDSRNIPKYGDILQHPPALKALREESFEAAVAVLAPITLVDEVKRVIKQLQRLREKLDLEKKLSPELVEGLLDLQRIAQRLPTN